MKRYPRRNLRYRLLAILVIAALQLSSCTPETPPTASRTSVENLPVVEIYSVAAEHIAAGEYSAAESLYNQALQDAPNDPRPALELARLYRTWNRPQAGLTALDEAIRRNAPAAETAALRLELLAQDGNWLQLTSEGATYLDAAPTDSHTLEYLTRAYLQTYQCAAAAAAAQRWRDTAPGNLDAHTTLGALAGDVLSLCETDARFCVIPPTGGDVQLGIALIRDENWPLAACVLARAAAQDDAPAEAHAWFGEALARIGRPAEARPHFLKATALAPQSPLPWLLLGLHDLSQQQTDDASKALLRARSLDPSNPLICLSLAEAKAQTGAYDEIDAWIAAALNLAPTDVDVAKTAARFYLERNLIQNEYPMRPIQSALQLAPKDGEAYMLLGWFRLMAGDTTGARTALDEAVTLAPSLGQAHYLRGLALQAAGNTDAAQAAFTRAADLGYWR